SRFPQAGAMDHSKTGPLSNQRTMAAWIFLVSRGGSRLRRVGPARMLRMALVQCLRPDGSFDSVAAGWEARHDKRWANYLRERSVLSLRSARTTELQAWRRQTETRESLG